MKQILELNIAGQPVRWIDVEEAVSYYATDKVAWELGEHRFNVYGGMNRHGIQSKISVAPIVAKRGSDETMSKSGHYRTPDLSNGLLFARDRHICAYCGERFKRKDLSRDHIIPKSRGGKDTWGNCVAACLECNQRKAAKTPEEAGMPLIYLPYTPNRYEEMLVSASRKILADVQEFLLAGLPKNSRMRN